ncbi:N-acetyltransferase [bacterium]|nr:N-acetyltransferase [bacterium]
MAVFIHPTAVVESKKIDDGTKIWHFAHIREDAVVGKNCIIGKGVYIDTDVRIGNNCKIQNFVSVYRGVEIEDDVFVGPSATFTNDMIPRAFIWSDEKIVKTFVKKGASIGANATIVCGNTIGKYAMVGAGSVVTKDVPDFGLVYGNPATLRGFVCECGKKLKKIIKEIEDEVIFKCECGKEIKIKKKFLKEVKK